jgi:hypothetical protein
VEAMMDCLRLEWSKEIAESVITFVDCLNEYKRPPRPPASGAPADLAPHNVTINVALTHINLFLILDEHMCLMTRIDAISLEKAISKSSAHVSGLKVVDMVPYKGKFDLIICTDIIG